MIAEMEALSKRFVFNSGMIQKITEGFEESDWGFSLENGGNSAHWLIGHLALYRRILRRKLGDDISEENWEHHFRPRVDMVPLQELPATDFLLDDFLQSRKQIAELLTSLTDEKANEDWGREFPDGSTTIRGGTYFLHFHESYHTGQIGYIRRTLGKPGLR